MNERFRELARQAGICIVSEPFDDASQSWNNNMEKFAELIVRECATWMEDVKDQQGDRIGDSSYWANIMRRHYGVEE